MIKKKGISKERAKEIKQERRTLKNRGYAANCRVKREKEEKNLEVANEELRKEIYAKRVRAQDIRQDAKNIKEQMRLLLREIEQLKEEEIIMERKISQASNGEVNRLGSLMTEVKLENVDEMDHPPPIPFRIRN